MKRVISFFPILFCLVLASCGGGSKAPIFPIEETLTQELMPLQGITNPLIVEVKSPYLVFINMNIGMAGNLLQSLEKTGLNQQP